jgi:F0F1-type ATP synthase membrane subunit b/b'
MQINLMPDYSLIAIMVIFIMTYFVVRKFFIEPINNVLEARENETKSAEQIYEEAMARFNEATAKVEERLHLAKREAAQVRDRLRAEAAAHRSTVVQRTATEAKKLIGDAETRLSEDVKTARETIVKESESLARLAAERILGRSL